MLTILIEKCLWNSGQSSTPVGQNFWSLFNACSQIMASIGELQLIHGANEHVPADNLRRTAEFYACLVATMAR